MADAKKQTATPVIPDFRDVDSDAVAAAQASLAGGNIEALTVPATARVSEDKRTPGATYSRWQEPIQITSAYRAVTNSKLIDVTLGIKVRQSDENSGKRTFVHFYINPASDVPEGHVMMNDKSNGAIATLLIATGLMPSGGAMKASLLGKMFPKKGQPGTASPLVGKTALANIVQQYAPKKDKNKQVVKDAKGKPVFEARDSAESFLPDEE